MKSPLNCRPACPPHGALGLEPATANKSERRVLRYLRENPEVIRQLEELVSTRARP
ncbi:MAG: hypothetical protein OT477_05850 [Chloroflexi bacterium]|nr:hypothetical protein [Chloroflexota bacterium]